MLGRENERNLEGFSWPQLGTGMGVRQMVLASELRCFADYEMGSTEDNGSEWWLGVPSGLLSSSRPDDLHVGVSYLGLSISS
jgi:hypothetical protein